MRIKTTTKSKNEINNKTTPVILSREQDNIFDLIFGLDASFLKILTQEGSSK